jgi:hypothetical protein
MSLDEVYIGTTYFKSLVGQLKKPEYLDYAGSLLRLGKKDLGKCPF